MEKALISAGRVIVAICDLDYTAAKDPSSAVDFADGSACPLLAIGAEE